MKILARVVAQYVLEYCKNKGKPISNLELQKMLYFIQIELMRKKGEIILEDFEAWRFGPVINNVYYDYCVNGPHAITDIMKEEEVLNGEIKETINKVINAKTKMSPWDMVKETHRKGGAWDIVYDNGNGNKKKIPKELIKAKELQV